MSKVLGRYSAVIFTIIVFLVLVIGVLGVNFNLSFQTEANAEVVNIAGRQRMLSQRIAKSLSNVRARFISGDGFEEQVSELDSASQLFNQTVIAFQVGGTTKSTKSGNATLTAITEGLGLEAVQEAIEIWQPLYPKIAQLVSLLSKNNAQNARLNPSTLTALNEAQAYVDANINTLLKLMNDLTNYTEGLANQAADESRVIQTAGIIASLFCFSTILYLIFGQLRKADRSAAAARQETQRIFETVDQGLFLIDKDLNMGNEHSKALESIFSSGTLSDRNLKQFLGNLVSAADLEKVERYLKLLFDPHKKQRLLTDLNPLNELAVQIDNNGLLQNKYLSFSFSRVVNDGKIVGVLSSVADTTKEVQLAQKLEEETRRNEQQLELISSLMGVDSDLLPEFLAKSNETYAQLNALLKTPARSASDFKAKADSMMTLIHRIKGESAALGLALIADTCHQFENQIEQLVSHPNLSGDEFLSLTVMLDQLIFTNEKIESVFNAVLGHGAQHNHQANNEIDDKINVQLYELTHQIADRQRKRVNLNLAGFDNSAVAADIKLDIVSLASQLLRNAISHGVEPSEERHTHGKPEAGEITLALYDQGTRGLSLVCEDDGRGIDFKKLTQNALAKGLISERDSTSITPSRIINLLLANRLSSNDSADQDSGRGVGLSLVKELTSKLGGKMSLQTKPMSGTRFTVRLPSLTTQSLSKAG
ncbi:hypothetical protein NBRC116583_28980 [Arenicella sp. 4NH20-0111]|uniref:ATP-binding protein n=1 Tax=Arenicella sp. 4NH20-0111 TaxID=3127648 RepID=UPI00310606C5